MMQQQATPKPLLITELREMIILQLDPLTTLATAVRISRDWKNLIDRSPAIRRMLMLAPSSSSITRPYAYSQRCGGIPLYAGSLRVSPTLEDLSSAWILPNRMHWGVSVSEAPRYLSETAGNTLIRFRRREAPNNRPVQPEGSWRHIFITDPQCTTVLVRIERLSVMSLQLDIDTTFVVQDRGGIKLGFLEDVVQAALTRSQESEWGFHDEVHVDLLCSKV